MTSSQVITKASLIWDWRVRLCHWLVAALVLFNQFNEGDNRALHRYVGYTTVFLVLLRLVWGSTTAQGHADFRQWPALRQVGRYLRQLFGWVCQTGLKRSPLHDPRHQLPSYEGHNPAGAAMAWFFWLLILLLGLSGWMMQLDQFWGEDWLQKVHELMADLLLACIAIHISAAVLMSRVHHSNLIKTMITGKKS
ncbi:cytochrome b/b6 domain-containing protein [Ampullimonas aquatilis]|uniref:cytochrome b/b6 domain-containing protein n=1 Tax=Ampullimonas aquatilis TaxID=1341549 RepID=UPI003C73EC44